MDIKLIIGIIVLVICCILAFMVLRYWPGDNDCDDEICGPPEGFDNIKKK